MGLLNILGKTKSNKAGHVKSGKAHNITWFLCSTMAKTNIYSIRDNRGKTELCNEM